MKPEFVIIRLRLIIAWLLMITGLLLLAFQWDETANNIGSILIGMSIGFLIATLYPHRKLIILVLDVLVFGHRFMDDDHTCSVCGKPFTYRDRHILGRVVYVGFPKQLDHARCYLTAKQSS